LKDVPHAPEWRGDLVVVKYGSQPFGEVVDCNGPDFPIIKNWLINFGGNCR
jgi:hypothetical protein